MLLLNKVLLVLGDNLSRNLSLVGQNLVYVLPQGLAAIFAAMFLGLETGVGVAFLSATFTALLVDKPFPLFIYLIIAGLVLLPRFVDVRRYKPLIEEQVTKATGRPFSVGDDLHISLFPYAGVSFSDLHLGNPPGFEEKDFVFVKSFFVRVKLLPLLFRDVQVKRFILNFREA